MPVPVPKSHGKVVHRRGCPGRDGTSAIERQWAKVAAIVEAQRGAGRRGTDDRNFIEAVLWTAPHGRTHGDDLPRCSRSVEDGLRPRFEPNVVEDGKMGAAAAATLQESPDDECARLGQHDRSRAASTPLPASGGRPRGVRSVTRRDVDRGALRRSNALGLAADLRRSPRPAPTTANTRPRSWSPGWLSRCLLADEGTRYQVTSVLRSTSGEACRCRPLERHQSRRNCPTTRSLCKGSLQIEVRVRPARAGAPVPPRATRRPCVAMRPSIAVGCALLWLRMLRRYASRCLRRPDAGVETMRTIMSLPAYVAGLFDAASSRRQNVQRRRGLRRRAARRSRSSRLLSGFEALPAPLGDVERDVRTSNATRELDRRSGGCPRGSASMADRRATRKSDGPGRRRFPTVRDRASCPPSAPPADLLRHGHGHVHGPRSGRPRRGLPRSVADR